MERSCTGILTAVVLSLAAVAGAPLLGGVGPLAFCAACGAGLLWAGKLLPRLRRGPRAQENDLFHTERLEIEVLFDIDGRVQFSTRMVIPAQPFDRPPTEEDYERLIGEAISNWAVGSLSFKYCIVGRGVLPRGNNDHPRVAPPPAAGDNSI